MVKTPMTSLNHKHGKNFKNEFKSSSSMVKTLMTSLNHRQW